MELAKRVLEKYGWTEGQGLGKNLDGIKEPVKAKKKFDKAGIGHNLSQTFTDHWWEDAFNAAASSIKIRSTENGVKMEAMDRNASKKRQPQRIHGLPERFQSCGFLKRETLENGMVVTEETTEENSPATLPNTLSDEQLFQACGGRTAHKGARHGLKLSGKLQRLQEQEEALLKQSTKRGRKDREVLVNSTLETTSSKSLNKKLHCATVIDIATEVEILDKNSKSAKKVKRKNKHLIECNTAKKSKKSS